MLRLIKPDSVLISFNRIANTDEFEIKSYSFFVQNKCSRFQNDCGARNRTVRSVSKDTPTGTGVPLSFWCSSLESLHGDLYQVVS